jgi:hypothetical protein
MNVCALLLLSGYPHTRCGLRGAEVGRSLWGNYNAVSSASQPFILLASMLESVA